MSTIINAAPKSNLLGIKDESGVAVQPTPATRATHLPHVFFYAERGSTDPQLLLGSGLTKMYGARTFDYRAPYANHQTVIANTVNGNGNAILAQRIVPEDAAPPAALALYLDLLEEEVPVYERNTDGSVKRDASGDPIIEQDGGGSDILITGWKAKWVVGKVDQRNASGNIITSSDSGQDAIPVENVIGQKSPTTGDQTNTTGDSSKRYPIMEIPAAWQGEYGNRLGIRLFTPNLNSEQPPKESVIEGERTALHRLQIVEKPKNSATPNVVETLFGEQSVEFSFKEGALDTTVDKDLFVDMVALSSYDDTDFGAPFEQIHVYHDHIATVLESVFATEAPEQASWDENDMDGEKYLINLLDGRDPDGNAYHTYQLVGPSDGGVLLNSSVSHYASGGTDGTMTFSDHAAQVGNICENYGEGQWDFLDDAVYPQSVIYDSGYPIDVKKQLFGAMGARKDVVVISSTQDVSTQQNSPSQDSSTAISLRAAARLYPESEIFGTPTCRALVMAHSGKLVNSQYKDLLPLTVEVANKFSKYMGAGNRVWDPTNRFDDPANNKLTMFDPRTINGAYVPAAQRSRDWDLGMIRVANYDRTSLFVPAWQTVYDDDTSVLNAAANMWVAVELEKVCQGVWRDLTGIGYLTNEQFIERSNRLIRQRAREVNFDNRVVLEVETYQIPSDEQRGYSWSTNVVMYANNMKTVGTYTITARRMDDLAE